MSVVAHEVCTYPVRGLLIFEQALPDMCYATPKGMDVTGASCQTPGGIPSW